MKLTKKEKERIFWALIKCYPEFRRARKQVEEMFNTEKDKRAEIIASIDEEEKVNYDFIKRFADEIGIKNFPEYPNVI